MRLFPLIRWIPVAGVLVGPVGAHALTGVCPDGSIYIVQNARQIPCADAKAVETHEVPPIRPHYLPTPYTWKVWNERHSPNNAYNVIDSARQVRELDAPPDAPGAATPQVSPAPQVSAAPTPATTSRAPMALGLAEQELRDLFQIVELSQERAPARLARETADGKGVFEVAFAYSAGFEALLQESFAARGGVPSGGVLLFSARSVRPEEFYASFTFLQGHLTYQPDATDTRQLGLLQGRFGPLAAGEVVLGYVSLPPNFSLDRELDLYWDDRHITVEFGQ
jgi:hypothetical protein